MATIDYDRLADEFIKMVGQGNYSRGQRLLKQAFNAGRQEAAARETAREAPGRTAAASPPTKTVRACLEEVYEGRAQRLMAQEPTLTKAAAVAKAVREIEQEAPGCYDVYATRVRRGEAGNAPAPARLESRESGPAEARIFRLADERVATGQAKTREQAVAQVAKAESALYTEYLAEQRAKARR